MQKILVPLHKSKTLQQQKIRKLQYINEAKLINTITSDKDLWWRVNVLGLRIQQSSSICFPLSEVPLADTQLLNEGIPWKQDICVHEMKQY